MKAREIALRVLLDVNQKEAYANIALARELGHHAVTEQDRRFLTELVYGVVKTAPTLDWMIKKYVTRAKKSIAPAIWTILQLGFYQLHFMDKVPPSAACNESVNLAKKYGHQGTVKFVNAVLRSSLRAPEKVVWPDPKKNRAAWMALTYFHPEWLVKRWIKRYGAEGAEALCKMNNEPPALSLRTNTLKTTREELCTYLTKAGIEHTISEWTEEGILCTGHPALASFLPLQEGKCQVQDESSMMVAHAVSPGAGDIVIDTCSAPGGKTTHMAELMKNTGKIMAFDIHGHKLPKIEENAARLGISIIETQEKDALTLPGEWKSKADCVLVDAPCSGLGVLRRKPDSRWRKSEELLTELPKLQLAILERASECVKDGGTLVYSTCTIEPEENQMVVEAFLMKHTEFVLETIPCKKQSDTKWIQFLPHIDHTDGFFLARMRKKTEAI